MNRLSSTQAPRDHTSRPTDRDPYLVFADEDASDRRRLRRSLAIAAVFHAALLVVTIPKTFSSELPEPDKKAVFVVQAVKFKPPEIDKVKPPERPTRRVPIPAPDPDAPEPLPLEENRIVDLDLPDDPSIVFGIPEAPPEPERQDPIRVGGEVLAPERVHYVAPRYTEIARRARIEGHVILQLTVDRRGEVRDIKVLKGLPMGLTEEAVKAVEQWKFKPSTLRGKPVDVLYVLTVYFNLE